MVCAKRASIPLDEPKRARFSVAARERLRPFNARVTAKQEKRESALRTFPFQFGAGEESRTLDLYLGKVSLYQLSYSRVKLLLEARAGVEPTYTDLQSGA